MKIIQVCYRFPPAIGGVENHVYNLSYELSLRGHQVTVFTSDMVNINFPKISEESKSHEGITENFEVCRLHAHSIDMPYARAWSMIPSLIRNLVKSDADVIHIHGYAMLYSDIASIVCKLKKTPFVLTIHAYGERLSSPYKNQLARLYNYTIGKVILNLADKIIVLNPEASRYFSDLGFENKIQVIPNGIEYQKFVNLQLSPDFKQKYKIKGKSVLFVGQLQQRKGVQYLLKSATCILKEVPDINFLIVGDGEFKGKLIEFSSDLKIKDKVKFTGFLSEEELLGAYSSADVFVLPSALEGLPTVILEAMASEKPVVATKVGGIPSIVKHGVTGFLTEYGDEKELADRIIYLLENEEIKRKMGRKAKENAKEFSWGKIVERIEKVYEMVGNNERI